MHLKLGVQFVSPACTLPGQDCSVSTDQRPCHNPSEVTWAPAVWEEDLPSL